MNTTPDFLLADATTPRVGQIICRWNRHAHLTFLQVVKVNRRSIIVQTMTALTVRNIDGTLYGIAAGTQFGNLHVIAGHAYGDTFKIDHHSGLLAWDGQPVGAQRLDLRTGETINNIWKMG